MNELITYVHEYTDGYNIIVRYLDMGGVELYSVELYMRSCGINYSTTVTGILVEELGRHFRYFIIAGWVINNNNAMV